MRSSFFQAVKQCRLLDVWVRSIFSVFKPDAGRWDLYIIPKRRYLTTYLRYLTPQKSADFKIQGLCGRVACCAVELISSANFDVLLTVHLSIFIVLLTVHLSIFISVINQLDAQNFCFTISLFHASTCFEHMCSSSGGQNCITQPLVSSHL